MPLSLKDIAWLRSLTIKEAPELGQKLAEMFNQTQQGVNNIEQQGNFNTNGNPAPPPAPDALTVKGQNGFHSIEITHKNDGLYRGVSYFVEHDTSPNFTNPQIIELGAGRNAHIPLGSGTRYWRAYSSYGSSAASPPVYHGSQAQPIGVDAGGAVGPPSPVVSQGSGTGPSGPDGGLSGNGPVPFRGTSGKPPVR